MILDFNTSPVMIQELFADDPQLEKAVHDVFGFHFPPQPLSILLKEMDASGTDYSILSPLDCSTAHGCTIVTNRAVAQLCGKNPRFIGFASVDPSSKKAAEELSFAVGELGLKGLNLDPALQRFEMSSKETAYPVYRECARLKIPVLLQCGLNWAPAAHIRDGNPLDLEPAILDNPETRFVIAHLGWPWVNEAAALAMKYPNVFLDTSVVYSGTSAECLDHVVNTTLGRHLFERNLVDKVVYGSAYPRADMRRTVRGIRQLNFSGNFSENLYHKTAHRLLGVEK
jgi:uncharacterized protein